MAITDCSADDSKSSRSEDFDRGALKRERDPVPSSPSFGSTVDSNHSRG